MGKTCLVCGIEIEDYKSDKRERKFCNRACYLKDHSKNMKIISCSFCDKKIRVRFGQKYCNRRCELNDSGRKRKYGGKYLGKNGYWCIKTHRNKKNGGYELLHRYIFELNLGRK